MKIPKRISGGHTVSTQKLPHKASDTRIRRSRSTGISHVGSPRYRFYIVPDSMDAYIKRTYSR